MSSRTVLEGLVVAALSPSGGIIALVKISGREASFTHSGSEAR